MNNIYLCMLKKYHIGSVFKLPMLYRDFLLIVNVFFFLGELLINYISYYASTAPRNLHVLEKKLCELFIPYLLRDVLLLDGGIIFLSPKIFLCICYYH